MRNHPRESRLARVEPYVVAAEDYVVTPHTTHCGRTWCTGLAGWMYWRIGESLWGLRRDVVRLHLAPFDVNPLRDILVSQVDFERLRADCRIELFIAATRVSTGTLRLFRTHELTLDALLASACLPAVHHSIEIDREAYWDGGLTANPSILPLLHQCTASDMIMVLLHPAPTTEALTSADEISRRLTEISFTSGFFAELQGLAAAKREAEREWVSLGRLQRKLRRFHTHLIDSREYMSRLSSLSKANTHASFIAALHDEGRTRAELWLENNFRLIGARSSCSLDQILC